MAEFKIHTVINSNYLVFDKSGKLPFDIVFSLCRPLGQDTDPRKLGLKTMNSILDIPYALSNKLLSLRENDVELDVGQLKPTDPKSLNKPFITIPSRVGDGHKARKIWTAYHYHIHPESELALLLEPGKRYIIRNQTGDLGEYHYIDENGQPSEPNEGEKIVSMKANGRAVFDVVESLLWPPEIETRMTRSSNTEKDFLLEVTVTNMGSEAIAVQTRGRQRFLHPIGSVQSQTQPEPPTDDSRPRIIDPDNASPASTIQILDLTTNNVVREATQPGVCGLYQAHDPRPELETLTTLRPGEPVVRYVDISNLVSKLPDGKFSMKMEPRGMWWCVGDCSDFEAAGEERVPRDLYQTKIPPLMLECRDVIEIEVENGVVKN